MKRLLAVLALLGLAFVTTAGAQVIPFPQSLPANTVVGRTGISAGPAQAIPLAILTSNIFASLGSPCDTGALIAFGGTTAGQWSCFGSGNGTVQLLFTSYPLNRPGIELASGTAAAPVTTSGPTMRISRTENIAQATCNNNPVDNECNATLAVYSIGTAADGMQPNAILGGAQTAAARDAVGGWFTGRVVGAGTGRGSGLYAEGRRDTITGFVIGAEIRSGNATSTSGTYNSAGASDLTALWITTSGISSSDSGAGVQVGGVGGSRFKVGFGVTSGSVVDTSFRDDSSSTTSILINGTHTTQIAGTGFVIDGTGTIKTIGHITSQALGVDVTGIQPGDVAAVRTATTGVFYLGSNGNQFIFFDGAKYQVAGGPLTTTDTTASTSSVTGALRSAGGVGVTGALWAGTYLNTTTNTVNGLPACGAGIKGARTFVSDNNTALAFAAVITTGGAIQTPVYCDGTVWRQGANDNWPMRKFA